MKTLLLMGKAVLTSPSTVVLLGIVIGVLAIRWYCLVLRKLNNKRGI
jgi:hypothetical protein